MGAMHAQACVGHPLLRWQQPAGRVQHYLKYCWHYDYNIMLWCLRPGPGRQLRTTHKHCKSLGFSTNLGVNSASEALADPF